MNTASKPLATFKTEYLRWLKVRNLSAYTIKGADFMLTKFFDYLESRDIAAADRITAQVMYDYQIELYQSLDRKGRPYGISYQNQLLSAARQFVKFLYQRDYITGDPGRDLVYAKEPKRLPAGVLTVAEARKIITAPNSKSVLGYRDRTILEVLYSSGIRKRELNNLKVADVDYHDGFLRIDQGKGRKDRIVPIGKICCRYLENYIKSVRGELIKDPYNHHLFLSVRGNRLSKNLVWELVKKYAQKAKIKKNVYPHTFRHTCATAMLKNKADLNSIRKLLGHESLNTTCVYTHLSISDLKAVHQRCHPREKDRH